MNYEKGFGRRRQERIGTLLLQGACVGPWAGDIFDMVPELQAVFYYG